MSISIRGRVCPKGHHVSYDWEPGMLRCHTCMKNYAMALCSWEEPPKPTKAEPAKVNTGRVATWALCGGCGELFQPVERKQKVCGPECGPLEVEETRRAREHAEKVRAGVLE